jgi:Protein of unknown function (DUF2786)
MTNSEHSDQPQVNESVLETVRRLVALGSADSGATEAEREQALAHADRLMTKHAIDQAMLAVGQTSRREEPVSKRVALWREGEFTDEYRQLVRSLAAHHRVRCVYHGIKGSGGNYTLVGSQSDIDYFEMVWTGAYLTFVAKLDPTWNSAQTEEENVYRLKEAGIKWREIAEMGQFDWPDGGKLIRMYKRYCKAHGLDATPQTQRHGAYRASYARAFVAQIERRIDTQHVARVTQVSQTTGAELALRDRKTVVDEAMYAMFPNLRPPSEAELAEYRRKSEEVMARQLEEELARRAKLTPKQREAEDRRQQREREREDRRWEREWRAEHDDQGAIAGRRAADSVDLSGGRNAVPAAQRPALG